MSHVNDTSPYSVITTTTGRQQAADGTAGLPAADNHKDPPTTESYNINTVVHYDVMVYVPDLILVLISGTTGLYNMRLIHTPVGGDKMTLPAKAGCSTLTLTSCF